VDDARGGIYDGTRLASDLSGAAVDMVDLWTGMLGFGPSAQVPIVDFKERKPADWKGGLIATALLSDPVPTNAIFPVPGNPAGLAVLKLRTIDGTASVDLQLMGVDVLDDGVQLLVSVEDVTAGAGTVASGEYFVTLYYTVPPDLTKQFAALVRGAVVP
jgi:hypothetical protein